MVFRNCLGMMASVSTLARSMGAAIPLSCVNLVMPPDVDGAPVSAPAFAGASSGISRMRSISSSVRMSSETGSATVILGDALAGETWAALATFLTSASLPTRAHAAAMTGDIR